MKHLAVPAVVLLAITFSFGQNAVSIGADAANIRSAPNVRAPVIKVAKKGDSFPLVAQQGAWSKVKVGKAFGWVHGNSLEAVLPFLPTTNRPFGDPSSRFEIFRDESGTGPGMGTGQGTGRGVGVGQGTGNGNGSAAAPEPAVPASTTANAPLRIHYKPAAQYTESARQNQIQGTVRLRITFLSIGEIGEVVPISGLPEGLTEQAVEAARRIKFDPLRVKGEPRTTIKVVEYSFAIY